MPFQSEGKYGAFLRADTYFTVSFRDQTSNETPSGHISKSWDTFQLKQYVFQQNSCTIISESMMDQFFDNFVLSKRSAFKL